MPASVAIYIGAIAPRRTGGLRWCYARWYHVGAVTTMLSIPVIDKSCIRAEGDIDFVLR